MLAESLAHLHLTLSFPLPWALLLAVRRYRGSLSRRRFVGWLAVVLVVQVLCSTEAALMLAVMACAGAVAWLVFGDRPARRRLGALLAEAAGRARSRPSCWRPTSGYAFTDVRPDSIRSPYLFSGDALNLLIPTAVDPPRAPTFARSQTGSWRMRPIGLYVGLPIVALVCLYALRAPAGAAKRSLLAFAGVALLFTLGPILQIGGQSTLKLPWRGP